MNAPGAAGSAASGTYAEATGAAPVPTSAGMSENVAGALCYLLGLITGIIFLVLAPYNQNRNVRFHAFQSIFFNVAMIVAWIVFMIVATVLAHIPILGAIIDLLLWVTLSIGWLIVWLMLMFKAYNNQRLSLPIIGPIAEKQAAS
jgi:uncharacterized membrane protein